MSLTPGTRVGPYEVVSSIGAGGMGEVYLATDPRLGRKVALKVLPDAASSHPQRRARLVREAQVLAVLNHPNIATLLGIEDRDGGQVLVMEFVEGETLGDRLARLTSPLPIRQVAAVARQIVDALDAAHDRGIVHRDLKPENILVRPDGTVKVLDFGIAKVLEAAGEDSQAPLSTITDVADGAPAVIAGTPSYMSPEQIRAEPVTPSVDIWAFGCVLYEMLTGRPAFGARTRREMFTRVIEGDADFSLLPPGTPALINRLVRRCLEKDPRDRLRHIADARAYLEDALASSTDVHASPAPPGRRRVPMWIGMTALAAALTGASAAWLLLDGSTARVTRLVILTESPAVLSETPDRSLALTHDGSRVVYVGNDSTQIFVRPFDSFTASAVVTATPGFELRGLAVSPTDQWLAYVENTYTLRKVALTGGPPQLLARLDAPSRGAAWHGESHVIFATNSTATGLQRIPSDGGAATVLTRPDPAQGEAAHTWPEVLPDGSAVLFTIMPTSGDLDFDAARVAVLDLASGATKTLLHGARGARYLSTGHIVFVAGSELRAVAFDAKRREVRGTPVALVPRIVTDNVGGADFSVSHDGTLAYLEPRANARTLVWVDRQGRETPLSGSSDMVQPRISPLDDTRIAASTFRDLFVWQPPAPPVQLTFTPFPNWLPVWTPKGDRLVFGSWRAGKGVSNIYMQAADGTGAVERLSDSPHMQLPYSITPDGAAVLFTVFGPPTGPDIRMLGLAGHGGNGPADPGRAAFPADQVVLASPRHERNGIVSPDGRWLAYESDTPGAPGQMNIYVRRFPVDADGGVWQVSDSGGTHPLWNPRGRELFYLDRNGSMMAVPVMTQGDLWLPATPERLFGGPYLIRTSEVARQYDTSDGQRFLMIRQQPPDTPRPIVIVQDWAVEVQERVR